MEPRRDISVNKFISILYIPVQRLIHKNHCIIVGGLIHYLIPKFPLLNMHFNEHVMSFGCQYNSLTGTRGFTGFASAQHITYYKYSKFKTGAKK